MRTCDHDRVAPPVLDPATTLGAVRLRVADLAGARSFYERALGLEARADGEVVALGVPGGPALVELREQADAAPRRPGASGLFHLALLLPSRAELARALWRLARERVPLTGASDHLVSEALYLADPEGNGIELYRDRPREEWERDGGELRMATLPLDLDPLLAEAPAEPEAAIAPGTRLGHVHLQVADLRAAEAFYGGALGFEAMVRGSPGALFLAAGGYHHHVGLNTWASRSAAAVSSRSPGRTTSKRSSPRTPCSFGGPPRARPRARSPRGCSRATRSATTCCCGRELASRARLLEGS